MKRAASLNYLNQPSAAPLQVRAVLMCILGGEKERTATEQAQLELGKRAEGRGEASGMKTPARELELADGIRQTACWGW